MQATQTAAPAATIFEQPAAQLVPMAAPQQALSAQAAIITPADLIRLAMESGDKDIDRLERLMAMDERYRESQERERKRQAELAFWRDFAAFRGENIIIPKGKFVDRGKAGSFWQAEFDTVCRMLSPALSKHGFAFRHTMTFGTRKWTTDGVENDIPWVYVTCFLSHRDGHIESLPLEGPPGDQSANTPVQNMQVTASLLKRQSVLAITGTATGGEDDEGKLRSGKTAEKDPDDAMRQRGQEEAMNGVKALNAWWGSLGARDRTALQSEFGGWLKCARQADARGQA